jgi:predicted dehydrogenase
LPEPKELRVALVGTGFMGRLHSIAYAILPTFYPELPAARRCVVADVSEALAKRAAHQFGFDEWAVGWESVVGRPDIDIVDIVTPNDSHRVIAEAALEHGKHVICEKPLAVTADEARRMTEQARRSSGTNMVAFNYRRCPAALEAKKLIDEGAIGRILSFRAQYLQDWAIPEGTPWSWRFGAREAGSGALGDVGSHALDFALYLVGDIDSVSAATETIVKSRPRPTPGESFDPTRTRAASSDMVPVDVDDITIALMRFENGALGTLEASRFAYGHKNYLTFEISGTKGAIYFNWERRNELRFYSAEDPAHAQGFRTIIAGPEQPGGELFWPIPGIGTAYIETQVMQAGEFIRAIVDGRQSDTGFEHGWRVQQIMETMLSAARSGRWESVETAAKA